MAPTLQHNLYTEAQQQFASLPLPGAPDEAWRRVPLQAISPLLESGKSPSQLKLGRVNVLANKKQLPAVKPDGDTDVALFKRWQQLEAERLQHRLVRANDVELNKLFALPLLYSPLIHVLEIGSGRSAGAGRNAAEKIRIDIRLASDEPATVAAPVYYLPVLMIHVQAGTSAAVELRLQSDKQQRAAVLLSRSIVLVEDNAALELRDVRAGADAPQLTAGFQLDQAYLGENSALTIGRESGRYHTGMHDARYALQGRGAKLAEYTLMQAGGKCFSGQKTVVEQYAPHTVSDVETRSILADEAHGMCIGTIKIPQGAYQSSGHESHRSLLLSPRTRVESLPELEIVENDVSCSHGSTITELDAEARHYLESRGISREDTRALLTAAFADQLRSKMPGTHNQLKEEIPSE